MKFTKKQWLFGTGLVLVLAGGSAYVVAHSQAQAKAERIEQQELAEYNHLMNVAKKDTEKAESFKSDEDVKKAQASIKKLKEQDRKQLTVRVDVVQKNWDLVHKAESKVVNSEKIQNDNNVKTAQTAIDNLKSKMTKSEKTRLQKRLEKVKVLIKNNKARAKAKEEAKIKAQEQAKNVVANATQEVTEQHTEATTPQAEPQVEVAPSNNTGVSNENTGNYQPTQQEPVGGNAGSGATPNPTLPPTGGGESNPTPPQEGGGTTPPVETFTGWVKNRAGQVVWSQGGFSSLEEAAKAAAVWANTQPNPEDAWSSGAY